MQTPEANDSTVVADKVPAIRRLVLAGLGFGLLLGYIQVFALGLDGLFGIGDPLLSRNSSVARLAGTAVVFVWYAVLGILRHYTIRKLTVVGAGMLLTFSTALLAPLLGTSGEVAMSAFSGLASGFFMLVWMLVLTAFERRELIAVTLGALAVAGLVAALSQIVGSDASLAVLSVIALTAPLTLLAVDPGLVSCGPDFDAMSTEEQGGMMRWLPMALFVASGCATALLWGASSATPAAASPSVAVLVPVAGLVCLATLACVWDYDRLGGVVWMPMLVAAVACLALVGTSFTGMGTGVSGAVMGSYLAFLFLKWAVVPSAVAHMRTTRLFACSAVLLIASGGLWSAAGSAIVSTMPTIDRGALLASSANVASLLLLATLAVLMLLGMLQSIRAEGAGEAAETGKGEAALDGSSPESQAGAVAAAYTFQDKFSSFAASRGLTAREQEIALLTARGYSSTRIAEMLIISSSTVRFHQQNLYRKLDVHSRQDYIDLVSSYMESLG